MPKLKRDLTVSAAISLTLLLAAYLRVSGAENGFGLFLNNKWFQLAAALAAQFFVGMRFYKRAVALRSAGVGSLIVFAAPAAFLLSIYNVFFNPAGGGTVRFESPSVLITLALLGEYIEHMAATRVSHTAKRLSSACAETAAVMRGGGELNIPAGQVSPGDVIVVRAGGVIPADGEILSGLAGIDETLLTGESEPVEKQPGDKVYAATACKYGKFEMRAEHTGDGTAVSLLIRALSKPHNGKSTIRGVFGGMLGLYAPAAAFAACAVFVWQWLYSGSLLPALNSSVAALMAAYPCALGLAAFAAIRAVTGKAAENGVFFTGAQYPKNAREPDVALLGKTGVITDGMHEITDIIAFHGFFEEEVVSFAAASAKNSAHPIDKAVYRYTQPKIILGELKENIVRSGGEELVTLHSDRHGFIGSVPEAEEFEPLPGYGIRAVVGGREVLFGSRKLLVANGVDISAHEKLLAELERGGKTVTLVAIKRKAAGVIATADTINPNARQCVGALKSLGIEVYMLTGDSAETARAIGRQAGIDKVVAGILPRDRAAGIARLKETGKTVVAVGCGANDRFALNAADLGISTGCGEIGGTTDITLLGGSLGRVPEAVRFSNMAVRAVRLNLFLSLACNAFGVTLAVAGVFPPVAMAAATALSCGLLAVASTVLTFNSGGSNGNK